MTGRLPIAMLSDPIVPQRDALMDADGVARRLSSGLDRNGGFEIDSCRRTFVSYRVGRRVRVVYRIKVDGTEHHVAASSFRSAKRTRRAYLRAMEMGRHSGPLKPAHHDAELNAVFWTFPNDRRIAGLEAVARTSPEAQALNKRWAKSRLVDYYPEVSAVVRCLDDSNDVVAYAKIHAGDEGERTYQAQQAFVQAARGSNLRLARPLAYSKHLRTLVVEPIVGQAIGQLDDAAVISGLHAYGAALAELHSLPPIEVPAPHRPPLERLQRKAHGIGVVRPDVEAMSNELLEELRLGWAETAAAPVLVHGDTNVNNAILVNGSVAFIDFDRASLGPAASDIGNFLGILRYLRALGNLSPKAERERANAFVRGYSSVCDLPDPFAMRVHISAALAERAYRAVNRIRPRSLRLVPELLAEAKSLLSPTGAPW